MSEHHATIEWKAGPEPFQYETYTRNHAWHFPGAAIVRASAAPDFRGEADHVDPEQAFVAALSSCHMLTFLALAAKKRIPVLSYTDEAIGTLAKGSKGKLCMTLVRLRPRIEFENPPSPEELAKLHERAHQECFIANSVNCEVRVEAP